jgi:hypothetical protein
MGDDAAEGQIDKRPVIAGPPVGEALDAGRRRRAKPSGVWPRRGGQRCRDRGQVRRRGDGAGGSAAEGLDDRGHHLQDVPVDRWLRDADLRLADARLGGGDRRRVLARLTDDEIGMPAVTRPPGRGEHRRRALFGEQCAVDETHDGVWRPSADARPYLVDHRRRRLTTNLVGELFALDLSDQRRRDQDQRLVSQPPDRPCDARHRIQMSRPAERAGQQHPHPLNLSRADPVAANRCRSPESVRSSFPL